MTLTATLPPLDNKPRCPGMVFIYPTDGPTTNVDKSNKVNNFRTDIYSDAIVNLLYF